MSEPTLCRFCRGEAVARFALSAGCFCHPEDRVQDLCPQHVVKATPVEGFALVEVLQQNVWEWMIANGSVRDG